MNEFEVGEEVEIQAGRNFAYWNGKHGTVTLTDDPIYIHVFVKGRGYGISAWRPYHLCHIDLNSEVVEAELGEGYLV